MCGVRCVWCVGCGCVGVCEGVVCVCEGVWGVCEGVGCVCGVRVCVRMWCEAWV